MRSDIAVLLDSEGEQRVSTVLVTTRKARCELFQVDVSRLQVAAGEERASRADFLFYSMRPDFSIVPSSFRTKGQLRSPTASRVGMTYNR